MTRWLTSGIMISGIVVSWRITRPYKTRVFVIISMANGINFVGFCIQFHDWVFQWGPMERKAMRLFSSKNSRFVMLTGCGDLEHAWYLTLNQIVDRRGAPTFFFWQQVTTVIVNSFADRTCTIHKTGQWTYNVTLRRVRTTIVAVEKQWVLHNLSVCICSPMYPACNAYAPYCHLWPAPLYNIFPHYLINGTIFGKKFTEHKMCVLIFSTTFVWSIAHSKKKWARYDKKMYVCRHVKYPLFLSDFDETWIFATDFQKILKYEISRRSVHWEPSCSMRTDGQT